MCSAPRRAVRATRLLTTLVFGWLWRSDDGKNLHTTSEIRSLFSVCEEVCFWQVAMHWKFPQTFNILTADIMQSCDKWHLALWSVQQCLSDQRTDVLPCNFPTDCNVSGSVSTKRACVWDKIRIFSAWQRMACPCNTKLNCEPQCSSALFRIRSSTLILRSGFSPRPKYYLLGRKKSTVYPWVTEHFLGFWFVDNKRLCFAEMRGEFGRWTIDTHPTWANICPQNNALCELNLIMSQVVQIVSCQRNASLPNFCVLFLRLHSADWRKWNSFCSLRELGFLCCQPKASCTHSSVNSFATIKCLITRARMTHS